MPDAPIRLAADIGGTFTDIVLDVAGTRHSAKVLTTPQAPEQAVVAGTRGVLAAAGRRFSDITLFVHGTTLATNAIIERKGARTALLATEGFRDVIEIADEGRFDQYDVLIEKTPPLVPRRLRLTVPERIDVTGAVRLALDEQAVRAAARRLAEEKVEAVAVAFIHAYANSAHERRVREILAETLPGVAVTLSSEACPEAREYERTSTAVANAYVQPLMAGYLGRLEQAFAAEGCRAPIQLVTSGGSLASLETARRFPVRLVESGPAGGAILAARIAAERGEREIVSFDMGGTTAKICLIENYEPLKARSFEVDRRSRFMKGSGLPVRIPVIEMVEIGAGGGSLARVDAMGRIMVGPQSAGSEPGPACYDRGGEEPAVTDADVALGRIDAARFAGGRIALAPGRSSRAIERHVAKPLSTDLETAAYGIGEIVDENMANAARVHAVERGIAIAGRTLVAFGGAAPLHACRLAEKLSIGRIIVPAGAGVGSAIGFLEAPAAYEIVRSDYLSLEPLDTRRAGATLDAMSREARALAAKAAGGRRLIENRSAFMRYAGQGHEIRVGLGNGRISERTAASLRTAFEAEYERLFARHIPGAQIEIMSFAVLVTTLAEPPRRLTRPNSTSRPKPAGERTLFDPGLGRRVTVPVFERSALKPGARIAGPAVVVEDGTSTILSARFDAEVDQGEALVLTLKETR
jgi:N-methylhydantoinase A